MLELDLLNDFNKRLEHIEPERKEHLQSIFDKVVSDNGKDLAEAFYELYNNNVKHDDYGIVEDLKSAVIFAIGKQGVFGSIVEQQELLLQIRELEKEPFRDRVLGGDVRPLFSYAVLVRPPEQEELLSYFNAPNGREFGNTRLTHNVRDIIRVTGQTAGYGITVDSLPTLELDKEIVISKPYYNLSAYDLAMAILQENPLQNGEWLIRVSMETVEEQCALIKYCFRKKEAESEVN